MLSFQENLAEYSVFFIIPCRESLLFRAFFLKPGSTPAFKTGRNFICLMSSQICCGATAEELYNYFTDFQIKSFLCFERIENADV